MAYLFILIGAVLRVIPHPANFAPIAAIGMFGGAYLNKRVAMVLPLAAMILSDIFIGFDSLESRISVYGCFLFSVVLGLWLRNNRSFAKVVGASLASSIVFFLVTNFVWLHGTQMYPHTFEGMIAAYTNAIPFFRNTLLGDLFYTGVFFGSYEFVKAWQARLAYAKNY